MTRPLDSQIRIMLVDDSAVVRGLMVRALSDIKQLTIVHSVANGRMAVQALSRERVDVIILDLEMPEMDGIAALPKLLEIDPGVKIIIASSLSVHNAEISLKALTLGASDYLAKPSSRTDGSAIEQFYHELKRKILALGGTRHPVSSASADDAKSPIFRTGALPAAAKPAGESRALPAGLIYPTAPVKAVAVASSTGGPQALLTLFGGLKDVLKMVPIFITQHMPPTFTTILADHLGRVSGRPCMEGKNGLVVCPNQIYVAPGNYHMVAERNGSVGEILIRIHQEPPENFCRPAADPMLRSLASLYGRHLLVVVLTGMGQDGLEGARMAAKAGATIIAQDEASSVVWGMPKAVAEDKLCAAILPLDKIAGYVTRACGEAP